MIARYAAFIDIDQLVELARLYMQEAHPSAVFDEDLARFTFAGSTRLDPIVVVLVEACELVGFLLAKARSMPFLQAQIVEQQDCFVRADKRTPEAEAQLLQQLHTLTGPMGMAEKNVYVPANGAGTMQLYEHMRRLGYEAVSARMRLTDGSKTTSLKPSSNVGLLN